MANGTTTTAQVATKPDVGDSSRSHRTAVIDATKVSAVPVKNSEASHAFRTRGGGTPHTVACTRTSALAPR